VNVLLFGATGMVGQGVLRECLLAPDVERVQTVGRSATGQLHPTLRELVHGDLLNCSQVGKAMLNVARRGWPTPILEQRDIARASA
jgi:hypothetical protein